MVREILRMTPLESESSWDKGAVAHPGCWVTVQRSRLARKHHSCREYEMNLKHIFTAGGGKYYAFSARRFIASRTGANSSWPWSYLSSCQASARCCRRRRRNPANPSCAPWKMLWLWSGKTKQNSYVTNRSPDVLYIHSVTSKIHSYTMPLDSRFWLVGRFVLVLASCLVVRVVAVVTADRRSLQCQRNELESRYFTISVVACCLAVEKQNAGEGASVHTSYNVSEQP